MKALRKNIQLFLIAYRSYSVYLYDILGINITYILRVIIIVFLYKAIYNVGGTWNAIGWYTLEELSWALIFVQALVVSKPRITQEINTDVQWWKIVAYLLNPISYVTYKFNEHFSRFIYNIGISLTIWLILWYLLLGSIHTSVFGILGGIILVVGSMLISFFWYMMVGLSALFIEDSEGFRTIYSAIDRLFAGNILPIPFFPMVFQQIIFLSPFAYTGYTAWLIFVRFETHTFLHYLGMEILWSGIYIGICYFMYHQASKRLIINWG